MLEGVTHGLHIDILERQVDTNIQKTEQCQVNVLQTSVQFFHHVGSVEVDSQRLQHLLILRGHRFYLDNVLID